MGNPLELPLIGKADCGPDLVTVRVLAALENGAA